MAGIMKQQQDKRAEHERLREEQLTKQFEGQLGSVLAPPNDDDSKS